MNKKISCLICAYNEGPRIGSVLQAVQNHPLLHETIVVDDGSSDNTADVVRTFPDVKLISYPVNRGKSHAMAHGITAAGGDYIMLIDADLQHLSPGDISALARPVIEDRADVSISLRKNAYRIHHMIGLDFTSGERVIPRELLARVISSVDKLPRFGVESYMNELLIAQKLRLAVVPFNNVSHTRKAEKMGWLKGTVADLKMATDVLRTISPLEVIRQNYHMIKLSRGSK